MKENTNIEQEKMDLYDDSEVALRTLSVLVENRPSVLSQVARLFTRNGYNIESIAAVATHTEGMTRLTIEFMATARQTTLLVNQLAKMVSVHSAKQLNPAHCIRRELALFKVRVTSADQRNEIIQIANIYRGSIIDVSNETLTVAVIGNEGKISALEEFLSSFEIIELARTGTLAMERGKYSINDASKEHGEFEYGKSIL